MPAVTPTVLSDGKPMDPAYSVNSIHVWSEVNRVPRAELRLVDGNAAKQRFAISDTPFFVPGATVEIKVRYEGAPDETIFLGIVVRQAVEASDRGSVLVIGMKDAAVRLTGARRSAVFREKTDAAIIRGLIESAGLVPGTIEPTKPVHREMVQYRCTPWDFIVSRADALGLLVTSHRGTISLRKMELEGRQKHRFEWGMRTIFDLEIEADADHQVGSVEAVGWDARELRPTLPSKGRHAPATPGDLDPTRLAQAVGRASATLSHLVPMAAEELQAWADSALGRSRLSMLRGRVTVPGFADIQVLDLAEVAGVGKRFNGQTPVTGVHQRIDQGIWQTDVQFGLSPEPFSQTHRDILEVPAAGLLPAGRSLQVGVVADFEADPVKELRVKVIVPGVDANKNGAVWAVLATPDAGLGRGYFFRPEPGDEVIVGFLDDDPRCAVILGSLYGSKNAPPTVMGAPEAKNEKKGIVTRSGTTLGFVDGDKASVFIETAKKNKLLLDDDDGTVSLSDQHGNSITLGKDGIVLKSVKDVRIDAEQNIEIAAKKVDVK